MATMIYKTKLGRIDNSRTLLDKIIRCINSELKSNIQTYKKPDHALAAYHFIKQCGDVVVFMDYGEPRVSIEGDEKQIKKTKSRLLKIVKGLQLN